MTAALAIVLQAALAFSAMPLWLDLRGNPSDTMDTMLTLYSDVVAEFSKNGLPPPRGAAIAGVLRDASDIRGAENPTDGELQLLVVDDGGLWSDGKRLGTCVTASGKGEQARAAAHAAVRMPEANLAIFGDDPSTVLSVFEFALAQAQHCGGISGSETTLLCGCTDAATVAALRQVAAAEDVGVPVAAILPCASGIWYDALSMK